MHYHAEVWIPKEVEDIEAAVEAVMNPHREGDQCHVCENQPPCEEDVECPTDPGFFDWYQIGARWSGSHDGYDPVADPINQEHGKTKWPTEWARYAGDIIPVKSVPADLTCHSLIVAEDVFHIEQYVPDQPIGECFVKTDFDGHVAVRLAELGIMDGHLVTVDYHS